MRALRLTAELETPIAGPHDLHLDAILMSCHRGLRGGAPPRGSSGDPLVRLSDVHHPSSRRVATIREYQHVESGGLIAYWMGETGALVPLCTAMEGEWSRGTEHMVQRRDAQDVEAGSRTVTRGSGPGRDKLLPVPTREAPLVTWDLIGDRREVLSLLRGVASIGALRAHGYGRVRRWECSELLGYDGARFFLLTAEGLTRRHLPAAACVSAERLDEGACEPPYWHPARIVPRVPLGSRAQLVEPLTC